MCQYVPRLREGASSEQAEYSAVSKLPDNIYSVAGVRQIDQVAIKDAGISGYTLMTRAARAALDEATTAWPGARRWQVVCGAGNNAGDGYVLARLAAQQGIVVSVAAVTSPDELTGDAATAYVDFAAEVGDLTDFDRTLDDDADLLVDALLGSGIQRDVEGRFAQVVAALNEHPAPVFALDLPSGLHGDSGAVMGTAVRAERTITFVGLKTGLFLDAGPDHTGVVTFSDLDIPASCYANQTVELRRIDESVIREQLPARNRTAHKGDFGHVLVVGGGPGMPGAAQLCGEAALRSGAGLVSVATHPAHSALLGIRRPELMCHAIESPDDLAPLLERATVIAYGPGVGTTDWARALFGTVLSTGKPLVVDADGLNLLAEKTHVNDDWILTPHPGEAGRLLGVTTTQVQANRRAALQSLAEKYSGTVVLKGAGTLVSAESGAPWMCSAGNAGMASPGMGDVLTGIIAAVRAQGLAREQAAITGVQVHAQAGDSAAAIHGQRGLIASDLIGELNQWVNR